MKKRISRMVVAATLGLGVLGGVSIARASVICSVMYTDQNYGGSQLVTLANAGWSNLGWMNDAMTSMRVGDGCYCEFWTNTNFTGNALGYYAANVPNIGVNVGWNDTVSSERCYY